MTVVRACVCVPVCVYVSVRVCLVAHLFVSARLRTFVLVCVCGGYMLCLCVVRFLAMRGGASVSCVVGGECVVCMVVVCVWSACAYVRCVRVSALLYVSARVFVSSCLCDGCVVRVC